MESRASVDRHDLPTIASMAVVASGLATFFHEGIGHGLTAWLRGDIPTELTSNHLSSLRPDHWVDAGGTVVNLLVGTVALVASQRGGHAANRRYFLWLVAALNLLPGAGYFLFSGILGVGDWRAAISDSAHQLAWRSAMTIGGAALYATVVRQLAVALAPFVSEGAAYNRVGRWPYVVAGVFSCVAGLFDPLGVSLLFRSTIPAAFGGSSGLLWADAVLPRRQLPMPLVVRRDRQWWAVAIVFGAAYVALLGPGIPLARGAG